MRTHICDETGNTLIEVFVALVIISAVLAGAYGMANRSITFTQSSQERAEAIKVAESQIDSIKSAGGEGVDVFADPGRHFCIDSSGDSFDRQAFSSAFNPPVSLDDVDGLSMGTDDQDYPEDCVFRDRYFTFVSYNDTDSRFRVVVRWERFGGGAIEQTEVIYGMHQQ